MGVGELAGSVGPVFGLSCHGENPRSSQSFHLASVAANMGLGSSSCSVTGWLTRLFCEGKSVVWESGALLGGEVAAAPGRASEEDFSAGLRVPCSVGVGASTWRWHAKLGLAMSF